MCTRLQLKPSSYVKLKLHIMNESVKNRAVKQAYVNDLMKKNIIAPDRRQQIPLIYDFLITSKLIMPATNQ